MVLLDSLFYLTGEKNSHCNGGLYSVRMKTTQLRPVNNLQKSNDNCKKVKKLTTFNRSLFFTDVGSRKEKSYNPSTKKVDLLAGDGSEGEQDGTADS